MPSRNVTRVDVSDSYYHVYARGASRNNIFIDESDYHYFLSLFDRYLSKTEHCDTRGRKYTCLYDKLELLAFCLMPNHFHLLCYQCEESLISRLMRRVMTSYSCYFNKKYHKTGSLFDGRYRSSMIDSDEYLLHISRYIHLNHDSWRSWPYSSYRFYAGAEQAPEWVSLDRVNQLFSSVAEYLEFMASYEGIQRELGVIKRELE